MTIKLKKARRQDYIYQALRGKSEEHALSIQEISDVLAINGIKVKNLFFGEGHTKDNIVSYIPSEKVLFGGCLLKTVGAKKGYLGDANTTDWSNTVAKIKKELSDIEYVIPGHGKTDGTELLTYTIQLFNE